VFSTWQHDFAGDRLQSFSGVVPHPVDCRGAGKSRIGGRSSLFDLLADPHSFLPPGSHGDRFGGFGEARTKVENRGAGMDRNVARRLKVMKMVMQGLSGPSMGTQNKLGFCTAKFAGLMLTAGDD